MGHAFGGVIHGSEGFDNGKMPGTGSGRGGQQHADTGGGKHMDEVGEA